MMCLTVWDESWSALGVDLQTYALPLFWVKVYNGLCILYPDSICDIFSGHILTHGVHGNAITVGIFVNRVLKITHPEID